MYDELKKDNYELEKIELYLKQLNGIKKLKRRHKKKSGKVNKKRILNNLPMHSICPECGERASLTRVENYYMCDKCYFTFKEE